MAGISLTGLSSGMDTEGMIQSLLAVDGQPRARLNIRESATKARQDALNDVLSRLKNLKTAASDLRSVLSWTNTQKVESSNPSAVGVRQTAPVVATGAYRVDVSALANGDQRTFDYTAPGVNDAINISGSYAYTITAGSTVDKIVADINGDAAAPVYVTKISDTRFALSTRTTGAASSADVTGALGTLTQVARQAGTDASYRVDGVAYTSTTNTVTPIAGLELTLKTVTGTGVANSIGINVSAPEANRDNVKAKLKAYVDQYNSTVDFIRSKVKEERVANPQNTTDARKGVLFGDTSLNGLLRQLRQSATDVVGSGNATSLDQLSELGISTGVSTGSGTISQDALSGKLVLDEAKLDTLLNTNLTGVKRLLGAVTGVDGFAQKVENLLEPYTKTGGTVEGRLDSTKGELTRIKGSMEALDRRLEASEKRYRNQFAALERMLAQSQSQGSWMSAQIGALQRG